MFCSHCGSEVGAQAAYCASCGQPMAAKPLVPTQGRIAGHVRLLGIFWLALSILRLIPGIFLVMIFRPGYSFLRPEVPGFVMGILSFVGIFILLSAIVGILTGWGLLSREPWARMLAIVMGVINLMDLPFGLALGIYTLWVLLPAQSERDYRESSRSAVLDSSH